MTIFNANSRLPSLPYSNADVLPTHNTHSAGFNSAVLPGAAVPSNQTGVLSLAYSAVRAPQWLTQAFANLPMTESQLISTLNREQAILDTPDVGAWLGGSRHSNAVGRVVETLNRFDGDEARLALAIASDTKFANKIGEALAASCSVPNDNLEKSRRNHISTYIRNSPELNDSGAKLIKDLYVKAQYAALSSQPEERKTETAAELQNVLWTVSESNKPVSKSADAGLAIANSVGLRYCAWEASDQERMVSQIENAQLNALPQDKAVMLLNLTGALRKNVEPYTRTGQGIHPEVLTKFFLVCGKLAESSKNFPSDIKQDIEYNLQWACHGEQLKTETLKKINNVLNSLISFPKWSPFTLSKKVAASALLSAQNQPVQISKISSIYPEEMFLGKTFRNTSEMTFFLINAHRDPHSLEAQFLISRLNREGYTDYDLKEALKLFDAHFEVVKN